jgi:hypothetical protein
MQVAAAAAGATPMHLVGTDQPGVGSTRRDTDRGLLCISCASAAAHSSTGCTSLVDQFTLPDVAQEQELSPPQPGSLHHPPSVTQAGVTPSPGGQAAPPAPVPPPEAGPVPGRYHHHHQQQQHVDAAPPGWVHSCPRCYAVPVKYNKLSLCVVLAAAGSGLPLDDGHQAPSPPGGLDPEDTLTEGSEGGSEADMEEEVTIPDANPHSADEEVGPRCLPADGLRLFRTSRMALYACALHSGFARYEAFAVPACILQQ